MNKLGRSSRGKLLAKRVIKNIKNNKPVDMVKSHLEVGYSKNSAESCRGLETEGYKTTMKSWEDKMKPLLEDISEGYFKLLDDDLKDGKAKAGTGRDKAYIADIIAKNKNLIEGKATEIIDHNIESNEQADKIIDEVMSK